MKIQFLKNSLMLIVMFFLSNTVDAQKIKFIDGLITLDGKPFVKMTKKVKYVVIYNDFWIQNLDGKELMYAEAKEWTRNVYNNEKHKYEDETSYYYVIHFTESQGTVKTNTTFSKKELIRMILKNNLVKDNQIDPVAERNYIQNYGGSTEGIKSTALTVIEEDKIYHYSKLIGNFIAQSSVSDAGVPQKTFLIYNNNGEKVAEANVPEENPIEWSVYTYSDEKMSFFRYEASEYREKLFKWISDNKYFE